jgi:flavodoxin I
MKSALILYGSTTGTTQYLSAFVQQGLEDQGWSVRAKDVAEGVAEDLHGDDLLVLGSSTWNDGQQQGVLQEDWRNFYEVLVGQDLGQRPVGVFGVGYHYYKYPVQAAQILADGVVKANGRLLEPIFRVDDVAESFAQQIRAWASGLVM